MTKTPTNKNNNGKDKFSSQAIEPDINHQGTLTDISQNSASSNDAEVKLPSVASAPETKEQTNFDPGNVDETRGELITVDSEPPHPNSIKSTFQWLKARTAAVLVGSAVMLPILGIGTATYYFGSQTIDKQAILAKRSGNIGLAEGELAQQRKLLAALLIGTGTTALLAGAIAALVTKRLLDSLSKTSDSETAAEYNTQVYREFISNLSQSVSPADLLRDITEEARNYLNCDRVVVYSLNQDKYGVIVAESVALGYTKALGKTISDPCFEARYLDKYRDGRVRAINDIYQAEMTPCHREQLEKLEVKANLVTPIIDQEKLFGLLVAHQCEKSRQWEQGEIEFLHQLAKKAGLALENSKLLDKMVRLQTQAETERKWTNYFTDAIQYIRQSIKQDDVLDITVEEVRRVLECDRVVVYSLNQEQYGVVVAESVSPGYPRALNKTIEDPCFAARYLDKYRDGRVRAINDIYEAGMTKCYIEQLETLEVKANLVTPILNEGKLFGLLVAHQCSQPRDWQDYEIRWVTQIATQVGFALDNAQLLAASTTQQTQAETERKWTNYFTDAIQYIRQSIKQDDVLDITVEEVRRVLECDRVVVYSLNQEQYGVVVAESVSPGYPRALNKTIEDPCFAARYLDKYRDGRVRAINDIYEAGMTKCYIEQLETLEVKANLVTPILNEGKLFGLLVAHQCSQPRDWQDYEIRWVTQIATQVGFALDNATLLKKLKNDGLPTQLLNNFSLGISERVNKSELLKIAVEQARKVIKLDRVIVYQFTQNWHGDIVAESVVPGYPRALNSRFKDPCFAREYSEKYRQGRIKAIANIHFSNLTDCHLEQLEALSVKASIIVPILQDEQLFGLLIGHQCLQPRQWFQWEIDLFAQLALQLGLALDRVKLTTELDAARNFSRNEAEQQQLEQENLEQKISNLLLENQAALQDLRAKISRQSATTGDFLDQMLAIEEQTKAITNGDVETPQLNYRASISKSKNPSLKSDFTATHRAIPEAEEKVARLNQSQQNLQQMVNLINNLRDKIDHSSAPTKPTQLPMREITLEASKVTLEPNNNYDYDLTGKLIPSSDSAPSSVVLNQFVDEITNLSGQISQQSLFVTESFQKLARFAKQLAEPEESSRDEK